jgi:hypothetical protein
VISRLLVRSALQVAYVDSPQRNRAGGGRNPSISAYNRRKYFPASSTGLLQPFSNSTSDNDVLCNIKASVSGVCERTYDKIQEACMMMLSKVEDAAVVRRSLGILSEVLSIRTSILPLYLIYALNIYVDRSRFRAVRIAIALRHPNINTLQTHGKIKILIFLFL